MVRHSNVLIVGSGIAALQFATKLRCDINVIILTKSHVKKGNSYLAQGGVAAAMSNSDSAYKHFKDTLEAGRFHNNPDPVAMMTMEAPNLISEMLEDGCSFDMDPSGNILLGMEGAHSEKRIVHGGGDATGKMIMEYFAQKVKNSNIEVIEDCTVYELMVNQNQCFGVKGKHMDGKKEMYTADHIVLATGGLGQIYSFTSNAETVTGDGIALAYKAGAEVTDMEFVQFHPTLLSVDGKGIGLVSEAVRGEGARLVTSSGKEIMKGVHPLENLAPRHIVSQTIYEYIKIGETVYLDISNIENFESKFPTITASCKQHHIDVIGGKIPVVPGCHFLMGGIKTDLEGRTSIERLYAIGEVACTGIHGANRLASNSLLEGLYFGKKLAEHVNSFSRETAAIPCPQDFSMDITPVPLNLPEREILQTKMMENTGIVRDKKGLTNQFNWLEAYQISHLLDRNLENLSIEEINRVFMTITAWLVTKSALERTESRGGHFREDYPFEDDHKWARKQIVHKRVGSYLQLSNF
ncbi:L-aspartate oxidase (plasmid) [Bacillus sp. 31A1R]|uniref:L-aspartate oxidase n=1 Tax=Robertmurraya mangrovi TaxID=3098077 RepID=A0ABU5IUL2_9BACI|nr:L-aspartate oxidase [Bacillus sp. 31A1R]MDZ5470833.1 L-aspartate oxidase [Bacillus sp. 31A1R]